jgi:formylglycine-generating enzyme required for sulfatase activity
LGHETVNLSRLTEPLPSEENEEKDTEPLPQVWDHGSLLPVRVILRDFAARGLPSVKERTSGASLWDFIVSELEATTAVEFAPYLKSHLLEQGGLLLLDGLDEVPEASQRRVQIKQAVEDFAASFPKCRILLTSRTYAYQQQAWRLSGFAEAVLSPFDMAQIKQFVDRWYAHIAVLRGLHPGDAAGHAELLKLAIHRSDRLCALAERPLLLTLMASLHAWRGGSLPEKREDLYADMVDLLLDWWESPKVVRDRDHVIVAQPSLREWLRVERDKVRKLLERLAYQAQASQADLVGTADIPEGELLSGLLRLSRNPDVNPARLIEYLSNRAGLLLPRGVGVYTFPQRTFQEYLAACYLADNDYPDKVAELVRQDPNRWREVALLTAAKVARGSRFAVWALVDALCYKEASDQLSIGDAWGALLAGQAMMENGGLSDVSARNQSKLRRVRTHLVHLLTREILLAPERARAGVVLAHLGDPRPSIGLQEDGLPDIIWCEVPAGPFVVGSNDADKQAEDYEKPQHQYDIALQYAISRYPVTVAQYEAFVQAASYTERRYWTEAGWKQKEHFRWEMPEQYGGPFDLPNHPVAGVSWYEAVAYCRWLTEALRGAGMITGHQEIRLPSEVEWEKAARGQHNCTYPWGNASDSERANYGDTGIGTTSAVGCFPSGASPYGVEDMSGNIWEWTCSLFERYPYCSEDGRENLNAGDEIHRVIRGGAFDVNYRDVRCSTRLATLPYNRDRTIGFRVVLASTTP